MPPAKKDETAVRITLRIPQAIHDAVVEQAARNRRSLNAELIYLVERALDRNPDPKAPPQ